MKYKDRMNEGILFVELLDISNEKQLLKVVSGILFQENESKLHKQGKKNFSLETPTHYTHTYTISHIH